MPRAPGGHISPTEYAKYSTTIWLTAKHSTRTLSQDPCRCLGIVKLWKVRSCLCDHWIASSRSKQICWNLNQNIINKPQQITILYSDKWCFICWLLLSFHTVSWLLRPSLTVKLPSLVYLNVNFEKRRTFFITSPIWNGFTVTFIIYVLPVKSLFEWRERPQCYKNISYWTYILQHLPPYKE